MPPLYTAYERGRVLIMYNASAQNADIPTVLDAFSSVSVGTAFWNMPATTNAETKEMIDAYFETFQQMAYSDASGYTFAFSTLALPYFPFFSNCRTFDSYMPIWLLLEGQECKLPRNRPKSWYRYKFPALPDQDDMHFVGPFDLGGFVVADWCERDVQCNYEEDLPTTDSTPRWFEASTSASLYQIIREPFDYYQYTGRTSTYISQNDVGGGAAVSAVMAESPDNFIDVSVDHSIGDLIPGCTTLCFARQYTLLILYYQYSNYNKRLVSITLAGDQYDRNSTDTSYNLHVSFVPLSYIELILTFSYDLPIFMVMFVAIYGMSVFLVALCWFVARITTHLQNPPELKIWSMLALIVPPPAAGVSLAILPIWLLTTIGNYFVNGVFVLNPSVVLAAPLGSVSLDNYVMVYNNIGNPMSEVEMQTARNGRIGTVFATVGLCCFYAAGKMYFPKPESERELHLAQKRTALAFREEIWTPNIWKISNFMLASITLSVLLTMIVEFSYWGSFGTYIWECIVMLRVFGRFIEAAIQHQLQDSLLLPHSYLSLLHAHASSASFAPQQ